MSETFKLLITDKEVLMSVPDAYFNFTAPHLNKKMATGLWNLAGEFYVVAGEFYDPRCLMNTLHTITTNNVKSLT